MAHIFQTIGCKIGDFCELFSFALLSSSSEAFKYAGRLRRISIFLLVDLFFPTMKLCVYVEGPSGEEERFLCDDGDSVESMKRQIFDVLGVPPSYQELSVDGEVLSDRATLRSAGIGDGGKLSARYKLKGGASVGPLSITTKQFELKQRTCCCYCGIDGEWDKCQYFCIHCACTIM